MAIDPNDAVNIPPTSTGPKTEAGKARSSRNAIRTGLYAARDFVRPDEEEEYAQTLIKLMDELTPENSVEQTFATEIMGATWRLRRCRLVEEAFSYIDDLDFDPMVDERTEKQQKSVDRARAQSHLILRRSLDELRKLQKGRNLQEQLADQNPAPKPGPASPPNDGPPNMDALMALAEHQLAQRYRESGLSSFCNPVGQGSRPAVHQARSHRHNPGRKQKHPPERPLPLPLRCKIQKMLWRSGRRRRKSGRVGPKSPIFGVENSTHCNRNARSVSCGFPVDAVGWELPFLCDCRRVG